MINKVISSVTGTSTASLYKLRQKSKLRWNLSPRTLCKDKYEAIVYNSRDGVHLDFVRSNDKKTVLITLDEEAAKTLQFVRPTINQAVKKLEEFNYDLSDEIRVSHEVYRKTWYVVLRMWYRDEKGDLQPGRYGINIPHNVWKKFNEPSNAEDIGE